MNSGDIMTSDHNFALLTTFGPAVFSAIVAVVVSWVTARYAVKHGPDYQKQLDELRSETGRIGAAQEGILAHYRETAAKEDQRREAAMWRPEARISSDPASRTNTLIIRADKHMTLQRIDLLTESGVVVEQVPGEKQHIGSREIEQSIPSAAILHLVERDPDYQRNQKTKAKIRYAIAVGLALKSQSFELPIRIMQDITDNTVWNRVEG